jgi:hypothetical protein
MKNKKSQSLRIIGYMNSGRGITSMQALEKFGCFRLASRIHELRKMGYRITKTNVIRNKKQVAQYSLN